jgi:hypothetical protein
VLHAIGSFLRFVFGGFLSWLYHHMAVPVGHGFQLAFGGWWPVAAAVLAIAAAIVVVRVLARRRSRVERSEEAVARRTGAEATLEDLERQIDDATARGDHEASVRLLFRWGVRRLGERGVVVNPTTRTDSQLAAAVASPAFADVQHRHERIVYGRAVATAEDVVASSGGWTTVLQDVAGRRERVPA